MTKIIWYASSENSSCDIIGDYLGLYSLNVYIKVRWFNPIPEGDILIGSYRYYDDPKILEKIYKSFGKKNCYLFAHGISLEEAKSFDLFRRNWLARSEKCNKILVSSKYCYDHFARAGIRTQILPFGVDTKTFYPEKNKNLKPVFGMAFVEGKGHRKGKTFAKENSKKGGIHLIFSRQNHKSMRRFYNNIDCLLVLSENDGRETFCLPILEAGACQTPVFSTPVGVAYELVHNHNGFIGNREQILIKIKNATLDELSRKGKMLYNTVARDWGWSKIIERWDNYFGS